MNVKVPKLPPAFLKTTIYLYKDDESAQHGRNLGGSGFLVSIKSRTRDNFGYVYAVTNRHVVFQKRCSVIRLNRKDGSSHVIPLEPKDWAYLPDSDDIAATFLNLTHDHDFASIPAEIFVTNELIEKHDISVGDDAFMIGRFIDHDGGQRNTPAARFGYIAMMPNDPIERPTGSSLPSYCIDIHSRTGYSGSPVFVYRRPGTSLATPGIDMADQFGPYLLGIHWGQFPELWKIVPKRDVKNSLEGEAFTVEGAYVKGMSGMTCVAPAERIIDVLDNEEFKAFRHSLDQSFLPNAQAR